MSAICFGGSRFFGVWVVRWGGDGALVHDQGRNG
ncbi:MAG: hypothetical protein ACI841_004980, partial [Planctomycetota bacterium]